jgi:hypothetical protein
MTASQTPIQNNMQNTKSYNSNVVHIMQSGNSVGNYTKFLGQLIASRLFPEFIPKNVRLRNT